MNFLKFLIKNPFSIATAIVHWLSVIYCFLFEETRFYSASPPPSHSYSPVWDWLYTLNFLPLLIVNIVGDFLDYLIGLDLWLNILLGILVFSLITFQWMIVGYLISSVFYRTNE